MKKQIIITLQFSAVHHWPECPIHSVSFLKNPHRHVFHVEAKAPVNHNNRDIEFINLKNSIEKFVSEKYEGQFIGSTSCEDICEELISKFKLSYVRVMEDNENGAEIEM